ncbi:MAG: succinyl-diaminopimelate desuccinylase [Nitrospirota bacterium]|nr:succinyl-diaminopimelate desuccinylase [Nitrospirota bacterium]
MPQADSHTPLDLARELIAAPSVTPEDAGCQRILTERLARLGFEVHDLTEQGIANFYARRGTEGPVVCFAGHTDVVAPGPAADWAHPPFSATVEGGVLYGRGAADMKGAIAAALCAVERRLAENPDPQGSIAFLITGDEEGDAAHGTRHMIEWLAQRDELPDFCIVGEPSSTEALGDTIKNGRRGSVTGTLTVHGVQGHVAFPERAENPIHTSMPAFADLAAHRFDNGNEFFQPTRLQMTDIRAGVGASNVIPGHLSLQFNLRFSPESTPESIDRQVREILDRHGLKYDLDWLLSGMPFLTDPGPLTEAMQAAIREVTGREGKLSTTGGTSDARFIAPHGVAVAELGLVNTTIHKVNECTAVDDLERLSQIYQGVLARLCG